MHTHRSANGRTVGVRLTEVPLLTRRAHGRALMEALFADGDVLGAVEMRRAIEEPSDRVYRVPAAAYWAKREALKTW